MMERPSVEIQTWYDHEEWSRYWLYMSTKPHPFIQGTVEQYMVHCIRKAKHHLECAKILRELDALHDSEDTDTEDKEFGDG